MPADHDARYWIDALELQPHPEGGFYRLTYTAGLQLSTAGLPASFPSARPASTAIYFLLSNESAAWNRSGHFSAFHRLQSDEMWHMYAGGPLVVHVIAQNGDYSQLLLGSDHEQGRHFQAVVPAGSWFASEPLLPHSYSLVGCTVAPGFHFDDFELARRAELAADFPRHAALIQRLTRR